jgi:hypothetical protein
MDHQSNGAQTPDALGENVIRPRRRSWANTCQEFKLASTCELVSMVSFELPHASCFPSPAVVSVENLLHQSRALSNRRLAEPSAPLCWPSRSLSTQPHFLNLHQELEELKSRGNPRDLGVVHGAISLTHDHDHEAEEVSKHPHFNDAVLQWPCRRLSAKYPGWNPHRRDNAIADSASQGISCDAGSRSCLSIWRGRCPGRRIDDNRTWNVLRNASGLLHRYSSWFYGSSAERRWIYDP